QFLRPEFMYRPSVGGCDAFLRGLIDLSSQQRDPFISKQVSRHLFSENPPTEVGEDLMTLNLERGREHGIPGYNFWRAWCGLTRVTTFDELRNELPLAVIERFKRLYRHVDDIDLWSAGVSEISYTGSTLGPTFSCMLATQFRNVKLGDRFWFENNVDNPYPFNLGQLQAIKRMTYSKIICYNTDSMLTVQPYILVHPLSKVKQNIRNQGRPDNLGEFSEFYRKTANERVPCNALPDLDLRQWQEYGAAPRPNNYVPVQPRPIYNVPQVQVPIYRP
ncbi:hypothetical protein LSH36_90g01004, partial [Paralvinella palmiformis]